MAEAIYHCVEYSDRSAPPRLLGAVALDLAEGDFQLLLRAGSAQSL